MPRAIVIYESRYGNTKLVGEKIAEGIKKATGTDTDMTDVKKLNSAQLAAYDVILIGSPNHMGGATRNIANLTDRLGSLHLEGRMVAFFDTYIGGDFEKAVKKLEKIAAQKAPAMKLISPGLSVKVNGMKGPVPDSELSKSIEFGVKIASQIKK